MLNFDIMTNVDESIKLMLILEFEHFHTNSPLLALVKVIRSCFIFINA